MQELVQAIRNAPDRLLQDLRDAPKRNRAAADVREYFSKRQYLCIGCFQNLAVYGDVAYSPLYCQACVGNTGCAHEYRDVRCNELPPCLLVCCAICGTAPATRGAAFDKPIVCTPCAEKYNARGLMHLMKKVRSDVPSLQLHNSVAAQLLHEKCAHNRKLDTCVDCNSMENLAKRPDFCSRCVVRELPRSRQARQGGSGVCGPCEKQGRTVQSLVVGLICEHTDTTLMTSGLEKRECGEARTFRGDMCWVLEDGSQKRKLYVEVDEHSHGNYDPECELARYDAIATASREYRVLVLRLSSARWQGFWGFIVHRFVPLLKELMVNGAHSLWPAQAGTVSVAYFRYTACGAKHVDRALGARLSGLSVLQHVALFDCDLGDGVRAADLVAPLGPRVVLADDEERHAANAFNAAVKLREQRK